MLYWIKITWLQFIISNISIWLSWLTFRQFFIAPWGNVIVLIFIWYWKLPSIFSLSLFWFHFWSFLLHIKYWIVAFNIEWYSLPYFIIMLFGFLKKVYVSFATVFISSRNQTTFLRFSDEFKRKRKYWYESNRSVDVK